MASPDRDTWSCEPFAFVGPLTVGATIGDVSRELSEQPRSWPSRFFPLTQNQYVAAGVQVFGGLESAQVVSVEFAREGRFSLERLGLHLSGSFQKVSSAWEAMGHSVVSVDEERFELEPGLRVWVPHGRKAIESVGVNLRPDPEPYPEDDDDD